MTGYRVISPRVEGMAFYYSFESQENSFCHAVCFNGFISITGTGGVEPAIFSQQWRYGPLIKPDDQ